MAVVVHNQPTWTYTHVHIFHFSKRKKEHQQAEMTVDYVLQRG